MIELYVFGSLTSGDVDRGSDADILVVTDNSDKQQNFPTTWLVYPQSRIRDLHARGTLFAWHLFLDAVKVYPRTGLGLIGTLGEPGPYTQAADEIAYLLTVGERAVAEIAGGSSSLVYELGLIYLMARDIEMAGAPQLIGHFTFSRNAPFDYEEIPFPLTREEYNYLMTCRRAATRGFAFVRDGSTEMSLVAKAHDVLRWCVCIYGGVTQCTGS
jgi:hypothetical protein